MNDKPKIFELSSAICYHPSSKNLIFQRPSQQTFKTVSYFQKITAFLHNGDNFPRFSSDTLLDTAKFAENYRSIIRFFLDKIS
jgi:hypothetical protein